METSGFPGIRTAADFLQKIEHDLARLRRDPVDRYAALDLVNGIRHYPEWLFPGDSAMQREVFEQYAELRIVRQMSDQGKHRKVTQNRHRQLDGHTLGPVSFLPMPGGESPDRVRMVVRVVGKEAAAARLPETPGHEVLAIAEAAMKVVRSLRPPD